MKLTKSQIKKYNKIADAGKKPIMVRVGSKWYTWYEGDPKYGVFLTTQSGKDVEFDFKQIDDIQENKMEKMKSKLREIIREEIQKLYEFQAGDNVKEMIEDGIHTMEDGFKSLRAGMLKAWESDIHDRSKINKELKNMNKEFDKIVKLIVKGLY